MVGACWGEGREKRWWENCIRAPVIIPHERLTLSTVYSFFMIDN